MTWTAHDRETHKRYRQSARFDEWAIIRPAYEAEGNRQGVLADIGTLSPIAATGNLHRVTSTILDAIRQRRDIGRQRNDVFPAWWLHAPTIHVGIVTRHIQGSEIADVSARIVTYRFNPITSWSYGEPVINVDPIDPWQSTLVAYRALGLEHEYAKTEKFA